MNFQGPKAHLFQKIKISLGTKITFKLSINHLNQSQSQSQSQNEKRRYFSTKRIVIGIDKYNFLENIIKKCRYQEIGLKMDGVFAFTHHIFGKLLYNQGYMDNHEEVEKWEKINDELLKMSKKFGIKKENDYVQYTMMFKTTGSEFEVSYNDGKKMKLLFVDKVLQEDQEYGIIVVMRNKDKINCVVEECISVKEFKVKRKDDIKRRYLKDAAVVDVDDDKKRKDENDFVVKFKSPIVKKERKEEKKEEVSALHGKWYGFLNFCPVFHFLKIFTILRTEEVELNLDKIKKGDECFKEAKDIANSGKNREKAINGFKKAIKYYNDAGFHLGVIKSSREIGEQYRLLGTGDTYNKSKIWFKKSKDLASEIGDINEEALGWMYYGVIHRNLNLYRMSCDFFKDAISTIDNYPSSNNEISQVIKAESMMWKSFSEYKRGVIVEKVLEEYDDACEICEKIDNKMSLRVRGIAYNLMAQFYQNEKYFKINDEEECLKEAKKCTILSTELKKKLNSPDQRSKALIKDGESRLKTGNPQEKVKNFEENIKFYVNGKDYRGAAMCSQEIVSICSVLKEYEKAALFCLKAVQFYLNCVLHMKKSDQVRAIEDIESNFSDAVESYLEIKFFKEARNVIEISKSIIYLLEQLVNKGESVVDVNMSEEIENLSYPPNYCIYYYLTKDKNLVRMVYKGNKYLYHDKKKYKNEEINEKFTEYHCKHYYNVLIKGLEEFLPECENKNDIEDSQRIIIFPHKDIFVIPFSCLMDKGGLNFVEKYLFSFSPSVKEYEVRKECYEGIKELRLSSKKPKRGLMYVDPTIPPKLNLDNLDNLDEALAVEKYCKDIIIRFGKEMSKKMLNNDLMNYFPLFLYFGSHAMPVKKGDDKYTISGNILFDNGEFLESKEIEKLKILTFLVFLNCCETGSGNITSQGILGLYDAFFQSGASSAIVTMIKVNSESAKLFSKLFFKHYLSKNNYSTSKCLRKTMLEMIKLKKPPNDWGVFQLFGYDEKTTEPTTTRKTRRKMKSLKVDKNFIIPFIASFCVLIFAYFALFYWYK